MTKKLNIPLLSPIFKIKFLIITLTLLCFSYKVYGQNNDVYLIKNIMVNAEGSSATEARNNAELEAENEAFTKLLKRLSLNNISTENFTPEEISDMVNSKQIRDERITSTSYLATFDISFSPNFVNNLLEEKNLTLSSSNQEVFLILPIKTVQNENLIWEVENDWRRAWEFNLSQDNKNNIKLPRGTTDEIMAINSAEIGQLSYEDLEPILNKYYSNTAVEAYYDFDRIENKVTIFLKTIKKDKIKQVKLSFVNVDQLNQNNLTRIVAKKTMDHISSTSTVKQSAKSRIIINILIADLKDWLHIESRFRNLKFVKDVKIDSLSQKLARISLKYNGKEDIISEFQKHNLILAPQEKNEYFLSAY